jgi:peptide-methionine (S)-S-oxide reductase
VNAPAATRVEREDGGLKTAYFAGGCFWGVEAVFSHVRGVTSAVSGYHGGNRATANYDRVSSGLTEHAETVRVIYDPAQIRYDQLLRIFFSVVADPTLRDRQGPDRGPQYRAALIPVSAEQRAVASAYLTQMQASGVWQRPIVTEIERPREFFAAEEYHQDFARRNPQHGYIRRWDAPKVAALARLFPDQYRATFRNG